MTDAELLDKLLAGLTPKEEHMLSEWKDARMGMSMQFDQLHNIFEKLHADKRRTAASIARLIENVCNDPYQKLSGLLNYQLARCYEAYCEHGHDCQSIHDKLSWSGKTKYMPIEFLTKIYADWLVEQKGH